MTTTTAPTRIGNNARADLASRLLIGTRTLPDGAGRTLSAHRDYSGLVTIGGAASGIATAVRAACPPALLVHDPARYEAALATSSQPMVPSTEGSTLLGEPTLAEFVDGHAQHDLVMSPTGQVADGDYPALQAVVTACNAVTTERLVCSLPVARGWLEGSRIEQLQRQIRRSRHPVALSVVGRFDPFENEEAHHGLSQLLGAVGAQVILHRTDLAGIHALVDGAAAAVVGTTAGLRHVIPVGQIAGRRRKGKVPGMSVFVSGIDAFVDLETLDSWFGDQAPTCGALTCSKHRINDFDTHAYAAVGGHNAAAVLDVAGSLFLERRTHWRAWQGEYLAGVQAAYEELRHMTGRRDIRPHRATEIRIKSLV